MTGDHRPVRSLGLQRIGWTEENGFIRGLQHTYIVIGIACGKNFESETSESFHRVPLLVFLPETVVDDPPFLIDGETVAKERGITQLRHQRTGKLGKRVGKNDDPRLRAEPGHELARPLQRPHPSDHFVDGFDPDLMLAKKIKPIAHQYVVVWFVSRCPPQGLDPRMIGQPNPYFGDEHSFEIECYQMHSGISLGSRCKVKQQERGWRKHFFRIYSKNRVDRTQGPAETLFMKNILSSFLFLVVVSFLTPLGAQEDDSAEFDPMVLVGALSASITAADIEFANLPSGKVLRVGEDGVNVLDPADAGEIDPSVPRVGLGSVDSLPESDKQMIVSRFERAYEQLLTAYDDEQVSGDDMIAIVKFILSLDLPFDRVFILGLKDRFGPIVDNNNRVESTFEENLEEDPIQVTDPADVNTGYFAP